MTKEQLDALRAWVQAEAQHAAADWEEDSEGYRGHDRAGRDEADRLFNEVRALLKDQQ